MVNDLKERPTTDTLPINPDTDGLDACDIFALRDRYQDKANKITVDLDREDDKADEDMDMNWYRNAEVALRGTELTIDRLSREADAALRLDTESDEERFGRLFMEAAKEVLDQQTFDLISEYATEKASQPTGGS